MEDSRYKSGNVKEVGGSRAWSGILLIIAGILLLAYKMGAPVPGWIFTWPMILILVGCLVGIKSRFHNPGAMIMIAIGIIFLMDEVYPSLDFKNYLVPAILISVGIIYLFRPGRTGMSKIKDEWGGKKTEGIPYTMPDKPGFSEANEGKIMEENAEYIEINAVFGGVKKLILSKNFRGGEINCFMGGSEINLTKADILQPIVLEVNNIFGGTKLMIPSDWDLKNEVNAVFGGIEDKRSVNTAMPDPRKIMVLKGTCVFGGIEVRNY